MEQHYGNHRRFVPGFHFLTSALILACLVMAIVFLAEYSDNPGSMLVGIILIILCIILSLLFFYARQFALKAQDRAIRAEENLRHFVLTGKLLDNRLELQQIMALRFAHQEEFIPLATQAAEQGWSNDQIKKAIKKWRGDHHRV